MAFYCLEKKGQKKYVVFSKFLFRKLKIEIFLVSMV